MGDLAAAGTPWPDTPDELQQELDARNALADRINRLTKSAADAGNKPLLADLVPVRELWAAGGPACGSVAGSDGRKIS